MLFKKSFFLVLILTTVWCVSSHAVAAPNITSTSQTSFSHNQSITVTGSSFGAKTVAGPLVWDDFESGTVGTTITGQSPTVENMAGTWTWSDSGGDLPEYSNTVVRPGVSTLSSFHNYSDNPNGQAGLMVPNVGNQSTWYFSFWWYYDSTNGVWSRNTKPWTLLGSDGSDFPWVYIGFGEQPSDNGLRSNMLDSATIQNVDLSWGSQTINDVEGEWIRIEALLQQSTPNTADGEVSVWIHRPFASTPVIDYDLSDNPTATRATTNYWNDLKISAYSSRDGGAEQQAFVDNFYLDNTQARIEIGNASTWGACTKRELQLPTSWADGSLVFKTNQGSFPLNTTVYLYVVDENGDVSNNGNGYAVTFSTDTVNPTLSSATVDSTGTGVDLVFNETVVTTGYTSGDFDLDCTSAGNNISLTSPTGSGTSWSFTVGTTINSGDTCSIDFNGAANSVEDAAGNDLLAITDGSVTVVGYTADTTNPSLSSATVDNTGTGVDLVFSETVLAAGYTSGDFDLDCTTAGNDIALSSPTGSGTNWSFTIGTTVNSGDTCNLDFNGAANSIEDGAGNDLLTITDGSVTVIGLTADTTNPTLSSATVDNSGTELDAVFSESVVTTGYTSGDFDLDCTSAGNDLALSSPTGSGTNWSFTISASVNSGDSCNIDFNGAANSIEDGANNDLLSITDGPVTVIGAGSPASSGEFSAPGAGFGAIGSGLGSFQ